MSANRGSAGAVPQEIRPILWDGKKKVLTLLDQTALPSQEVYLGFGDPAELARAIRDLVVRGAPAIGCAAAFGAALSALRARGKDTEKIAGTVRADIRMLAATRPTEVNLFWALSRMEKKLDELLAGAASADDLRAGLEAEAVAVFDEDLASCRAMGDFGAELVPMVAGGARILTHCNAGALATAGYGTALGVVRSAHRQGKVAQVWVDETRPVFQGARLTAWEMMRERIPATLICDNMAGAVMAQGKVDFVVVGADRIAANGDVANKIGTYTVAVLCARHQIPFTVAAPLSTLDLSLASGSLIPIEERAAAEVTGYGPARWAPEGMPVFNPAFDVTPAGLVAAIITEAGVARPPFEPSLRALFEKKG
jgi:methylthioribose-1-phosphate isomerase